MFLMQSYLNENYMFYIMKLKFNNKAFLGISFGFNPNKCLKEIKELANRMKELDKVAGEVKNTDKEIYDKTRVAFVQLAKKAFDKLNELKKREKNLGKDLDFKSGIHRNGGLRSSETINKLKPYEDAIENADEILLEVFGDRRNMESFEAETWK